MNYKRAGLIVTSLGLIVSAISFIYNASASERSLSLSSEQPLDQSNSQSSDSGSNFSTGGGDINGDITINQPLERKLEEEAPTSFYCEKDSDATYATFVESSVGRRPLVDWETEDFTSAGYSPAIRCRKASENFQKAYDSKRFNFMTYGLTNEQPSVCSTSAVGNGCESLLITLRHSDDGDEALRDMSRVLLEKVEPFKHDAGHLFIHEGKLYVKVDFDDFLKE